MKKLLFFVVVCLPFFQVNAQDKIGRDFFEEINLDLKSGIYNPKALPFDVPYIIKGVVPRQLTSVTAIVSKVKITEHAKKRSKRKSDKASSKVNENVKKGKLQKAEALISTTVDSGVWSRNIINTLLNENGAKDSFFIAMQPLKNSDTYKVAFNMSFNLPDDDKLAIQKIADKTLNTKINKLASDGSSVATITNVLSKEYKDIYKSLLVEIRNYLQSKYTTENIKLNDRKLDDEELNKVVETKGNDQMKKLEDTSAFLPQQKLVLASFLNNYLEAREAKKFKASVDSLKTYYKGMGVEFIHNLIIEMDTNKFYSSLTDSLNYIKPLAETELDNLFNGRVDIKLINYPNFTTTDNFYQTIDTAKLHIFLNNIYSVNAFFTRLHSNFLYFKNDKRLQLAYRSLPNQNKADLRNFEDNLAGWLLPELNKLKQDVMNYYDVLQQLRNVSSDYFDLGNLNKSFSVPIATNASTIAEFRTRGEYYITADLGVAISTFSTKFTDNIAFPYLGVNFNLRPINRQVPVRYYKNFFKRSSITFAITLDDFIPNVEHNENAIVKGVYGKLGFMGMLGYRINDFIRISGGVLSLKKM